MSAIGKTLSALNRFAGSEVVERFGLRKPAQAIAYRAVKEGFAVGNAAARQWKAVAALAAPSRLATPPEVGKDRFDLNVTEEQQMIRDSAQRVAKEQMRPAAIAADAACAVPDEVMAKLDELCLAQYAIPEALGGAGTERSPVTSAIVAETLGYGDMGMAVAALAPVGVVNAIVRWGSADQQAKYLPPFTSDQPPRAALAVVEPQPLFDPMAPKTKARSEGGGYLLFGKKSLVPLAESAELFLVTADLEGKGPRVFIVEKGASGLRIEKEAGMGVRAAATGRLVLDDVKLESAALLGEDPSASFVEELVDLSRIAWCAMAVGTAQAVLEYVVEYCNDRVAFGEPISHRQAVAFMIANIGVELEAMRLLTLRAASRAEQGKSFHREAYLARVLCAEKGMEIGTNGVQLLGGHGFIKEHPVERWYRDLRAIAIFEGGVVA